MIELPEEVATLMPTEPARCGIVVGGAVLRPGDETPQPGTVTWDDGRIAAVTSDPAPGHGERLDPSGTVVDATGGWVLPGIVDLHADSFERSLMPRPGVRVDVDVALADNDIQLLAAGITTSYLSATDSWEPGLRSRATLRELIAALGRRRRGPRVALHVRHERCHTDDIDELEELIRAGTVRMLSFNDHTPGGTAGVTGLSPTQVQRSGVDRATLEELEAAAIGRRGIGFDQDRRLAAVASEVGCPMASHDSHREEDFRRDLELGISIAEFPMSAELAHRYRDQGIDVLAGAPNLVRGRSHLGNLSVRDAVRTGAASLLCSDYHHPSLLQAPFLTSRLGLRAFGSAWMMVSAAPADAAGHPNRGRLRRGADADLIVVDVEGGRPVRVRATVVGGALAYVAP